MPATPSKPAPSDKVQDKTRTPGDGTLEDAVPAGLTTEQLEEEAKRPSGPAQTGTG